jgi:hypothetical protein
MLGLCTLMYQLLFALQRDQYAKAQTAAALASLGEAFRHDAHEAKSATVQNVSEAGGPGAIRFDLGLDRTVEYRVPSPGTIVRNEALKAAPVRRESFSIHQAASIVFETEVVDDRSFAAVTVNRANSRELPDRPKVFRLIALVGKNNACSGLPGEEARP